MHVQPPYLFSLAILAQSFHSEDVGLATVTQEFSVENVEHHVCFGRLGILFLFLSFRPCRILDTLGNYEL